MIEPPHEIRFKGLGVSEGIVIGQVVRLHDGVQHLYHWTIADADLETELRRFRAAVSQASHQVLGIREQAEERFGKDRAYIFDAHLLMLADEKLIGDIERHITDERANAEWAVKVVGDRLRINSL